MIDYCVELKVCEGCGALFLRAACNGPLGGFIGGQTTCRGCVRRLSEFPVPRQRRRRGFEVKGVRRCGRPAVCAGGAR